MFCVLFLQIQSINASYCAVFFIIVPLQMFKMRKEVRFVPYKSLMINRLSFVNVFNYWFRKMHEIRNPIHGTRIIIGYEDKSHTGVTVYPAYLSNRVTMINLRK